MSQVPSQPAREYVVTEALLYPGGRVHRWEEKAGFNHLFEYESISTPSLPPTATIPRAEIVDLTSKMDQNGKLTWEVPSGRWTIMRMGYSLTGAKEPTSSARCSRLRSRQAQPEAPVGLPARLHRSDRTVAWTTLWEELAPRLAR